MMEGIIQQGTARTLSQFGGAKCRVGTKPLLSFSGIQFEEEGGSSKFALAKSMFTDFFKGGDAKEMDVEGLQWMISFAAAEEEGNEGKRDMIYMRCWKMVTKRSGQPLPRVEVEEMGPRIDFRLGRVREADEVVLKEALKKLKTSEVSPRAPTTALLESLADIRRSRPDQRRTWRPTSWATRWAEYTLADKIWNNYRRGR